MYLDGLLILVILNVSKKTIQLLAERMGDGWDVVVERSHIHVEYDPR
jgi:hypothetical protein